MIVVGSSLGFMTSLATDGNVYSTRYEFPSPEQALSPIRYLLVTQNRSVTMVLLDISCCAVMIHRLYNWVFLVIMFYLMVITIKIKAVL